MRQDKQIRQSIAISMALMVVLFVAPMVVVAPFQTEPFSEEILPEETEELSFVSGALDQEITLRVLNGDVVEEMDLGTYLVGVVRAEMPASFAPEALKAQTVAARTYTLYKMNNGGNHGDDAQICTNSTCCQAYLPEEKAWDTWGKDAMAYENKIEEAVVETDGQIILYGGQPILAVFHSSSAGLTRSAGEVWTTDLPYLQAVDSKEAGDQVPNYYSRVEFTKEEFRKNIWKAYPEAKLSGNMEDWLQNAVTDRAGSVDTLSVGGVTMRGSALRAILSLRSACFEWEIQDGKLVFFVTGYGHGVGLSQYGANQMALEGADYREILTHYYTGVTVGSIGQAETLQYH